MAMVELGARGEGRGAREEQRAARSPRRARSGKTCEQSEERQLREHTLTIDRTETATRKCANHQCHACLGPSPSRCAQYELTPHSSLAPRPSPLLSTLCRKEIPAMLIDQLQRTA